MSPMRKPTTSAVATAGVAPTPTRRQVMVASLGGGFALATLPVSAQTIATDGAGLDTGDVKIPGGHGDVPAYFTRPSAPKRSGKKPARRLPIVVVVHEIFGVHEHIRDVCRRLAKRGYLAVAPDLFARHGDVAKMTDVKEIREKVVSKVDDAHVLADLDATVTWARTTGGGDGDRLAITGFCWGGRIVWLYAAATPTLKAGAAWYGRLTADKTALQPRHPLDVAAALKAPVLGLYGADDTGIPVASVEQMRAALAAGATAARASEIKVYPGAGHAFFADYRPSYNAIAATDGWARMLAFFKSHGVA